MFISTAYSNLGKILKIWANRELEGFSLADYRPLADVSTSLDRLLRFLSVAMEMQGRRLVHLDTGLVELRNDDDAPILRFTTQRETAQDREDIDLLGLDHPLVQQTLNHWRHLPPEEIGIAVQSDHDEAGVLSWWFIESYSKTGEQRHHLQPLAVNLDGTRISAWERRAESLLQCPPGRSVVGLDQRLRLLSEHIEPMLHRELQHRGLIRESGGFSAKLIGWIEF